MSLQITYCKCMKLIPCTLLVYYAASIPTTRSVITQKSTILSTLQRKPKITPSNILQCIRKCGGEGGVVHVENMTSHTEDHGWVILFERSHPVVY